MNQKSEIQLKMFNPLSMQLHYALFWPNQHTLAVCICEPWFYQLPTLTYCLLQPL